MGSKLYVNDIENKTVQEKKICIGSLIIMKWTKV